MSTATGPDASKPGSPQMECLMVGGACLKTWSTTQAVLALSIGEAEFYVALKGVCVALGFQAMCADLGDEIKR